MIFPKTNIEPANHPFEKNIIFQIPHFAVPAVSIQDGDSVMVLTVCAGLPAGKP